MKKRFFLWNVLSGAFVFGQITINSNNLPVVGSQLIKVEQSNLSGINVGNSGENQIYDFSSFTNGGEDAITYIAPSQTPYANNFYNSNLASLSLSTSTYSFFNSTPSYLNMTGMSIAIPQIIPIDMEKLLVISSNSLTQLNLPTSYQSAFNDLGQFNSSGIYFHQVITQDPLIYIDSIRMSVSIDRSSLVDGWGTIITPYGTFDILRQVTKDIRTIRPEGYTLIEAIPGSPFPLGYQSIPEAEITDTTTTYYYLSNSQGTQPLILAEIQENNAGMITNASYSKDIFPLYVNELNSLQQFQIYPNPSSDIIHITSNLNLNHLRFFSAEGKELLNEFLNHKSFNLDLTNYDSGSYTLIIQTEKGQEVTRINKL